MDIVTVIDIKYLNTPPTKQVEGNSVDATETAEVTYINKNGVEVVKIYNVVKEDDIYRKVGNGDWIEITECVVTGISAQKLSQLWDLPQKSIVHPILVENSIFDGLVNLSKIQLGHRATFSNVVFRNEVMFNKTRFIGYPSFNNSIFQSKADFSEAIFSGESTFECVNFFKFSDFHDATFKSITSFEGSTFSENSNFDNAIFQNKVIFNSANFLMQTDFRMTKFDENALFSDVKFKNIVNFMDTTFNGTVLFARTLFSDETYFVGVRFIGVSLWAMPETKDISGLNEISFEDTYFQNTVNFSGYYFSHLDLTGCVFERHGLFRDCIIDAATRETYRAIKHQYLKIDNRLDASLFFKKEMEAKRNEKETSILEFIILTLYKYINLYGTKIEYSFITIVPIGIILFFIMVNFGFTECYFEWGCNGWSSFWEVSVETIKYGLLIIYPGHKATDINSAQFNELGSIIHIVLRIYIPLMLFFVLQPLKRYKSW